MAGRCGGGCRCGGCAGIDAETPRRVENAPGRTTLDYRMGDHGRFKESLLARLSSTERPALAALRTRDDDDFTIALCDALATGLDVLTFYQERLAHEHYLRTATERRSLAALTRLLGYVPAPGVAASAHLAFRVQEVPADPTLATQEVTIPEGTRVQSVPGQDETAQTFETTEEGTARLDWNRFAPQLTETWHPLYRDTELYLDGVATRLQVGDAILVVGKERENRTLDDERWDVRVLTTVEADTDNQRTRVAWEEGLGSVVPRKYPAASGVRVYAFRQRTAIFGHNAPDPALLSKPASVQAKPIDPVKKTIDLDTAYPKVTPGSWVALVSLEGYVELYQVEQASQLSRLYNGVSGRTTRLTLDTQENLDQYNETNTLVLAESEALAALPRPLVEPVYDANVALDTRVEGLVPGQALACTGKRQRIVVAAGVSGLVFRPDGAEDVPLSEGDALFLLAAPVRVAATVAALSASEFVDVLGDETVDLRLRLLDREGSEGTLACKAGDIELAAAEDDDETVLEIATLDSSSDAVQSTRDRTVLKLAAPLGHCYARTSLTFSANLVAGTQGETVKEEILGDGDAGRTDQSFTLKQSPLTYVTAPTPSGRASTLEIRVNDLLWTEVASLYGRGGDERVYTVSTDDDGLATVRFGDGVEGARLPSGRNNVRATYRKGLGAAGNVEVATVTNLLDRPQGVQGATNPEAATGGEDAEALDAVRENGPASVLTLDRAVSVEDYADFARAFAGIAKAHALWIPAGPARGVFLSLAGGDGAPISATDRTAKDLRSALRLYGDPLVPLHLADHRAVSFRVGVDVKVADDAEEATVLAAVEEALAAGFAFDARAFGQGVTEDEVLALVHRVSGVLAARVSRLYRVQPGEVPAFHARLSAALPVASLTTLPQAAELLTIDADGIEVEELT